MNTAFKKLIEEINFDPTPTFKETKVENVDFDKEKNIFNITFRNIEIIPFDEMIIFLEKLNNNFKYKVSFEFLIISIIYDHIELKKYIQWIAKDFLNLPHMANILYQSDIEIEEDVLSITIENNRSMNVIEKHKEDLQRILRRFGYNNLELKFVLKDNSLSLLEQERNKHSQAASKVDLTFSPKPKETKIKTFKKQTQFVQVKDLSNCQFKYVMTEGEVFDIDVKKTKEWNIYTISITDYEEAVYLKMFVNHIKDPSYKLEFQKGDYIYAEGELSLDGYTKQLTINTRKIKVTDNKLQKREDDATIKRVELSTRTKMSTMDGVTNPEDYIKRAKEWGHEAIAIIDKDSVQSFPAFYHAAKDSGVKPIYGSTFSTISKDSNAVKYPKDILLANDTYVVFDIETTGLSPIFEEIIEFGAVKVENGKIIDKKQFFIKPTKKLSDFTKELTNIKDSDLENAINQKEGIKEIYQYLKGYTTVAHNANFDITFINEKLLTYGFETLNDPIIDSMVVARIVQSKAKRFRLENVATRFKVSYDSTVAHRADYDADILARVWVKMIKLLETRGIKTQQELASFNNKDLMSKSFANDVTVLAKNQDGLKELFKLVSTSLTKTFSRGPRLIFETIKENKNILMGSGALQSRLVDRMFYGSKEQIRKEISHYDYIEVQPIQNYLHYINRDYTKKQIEYIINFIVTEARKQNKIVVATGDVRYLDPKDKIYHEVYINSKGLGGSLHYLYKRNEEDPVYPDQHLLTTKEMIEAFAFLNDVNLIRDIVVHNTRKIADMIEDVEVIKKDLYTPDFKDAKNNLINLVYKNAHIKYGNPLPEIIANRLEKELKPIINHGFAVIYWISHLLVKKSLEDDYLVGSRGSVGSSLVATMANITEVNPMCPHYVCSKCQYSEFFEGSELNSGYDLPSKKCPKCNTSLDREGQNIPFETFLGFNADKVPDIDLNFSGENQADIHNYTKELFGENYVYRAGTISTVADKTAYGYVKGWAEKSGIELSKPFTEYLAKGVAGTKRTTGQHPGGIIIIPNKFIVEDFTPVNYPANDVSAAWKTTHFDFHAIHDNVLKLDILGHDDPTAIKLLEKFTGVKAKEIPMSDEKIISLFSSPDALGITSEDILGEKTGAMGIPEFGTKFVRKMLRNAKVESFGDLISLSGLSHGTDVWATNAEELVKKHNKTLSEVISCRDNIMTDLIHKNIEPLLAFQIMESVRKGKGLKEEWKKILKEHNVEDWYIDSLLKIKYMFPKAHATAYVMMAWRIAYFKLYYPAAYYATYFTARADTFDIETVSKGRKFIVQKLKEFNKREHKKGDEALSNKEKALIPIFEIANEALARGIKILNIDINKSLARKWVIEDNNLIPPFSVVDGLGDAAANSIVKARNEKEFTSIEDLMSRTQINKTVLAKFEKLGILKHLSQSNQMELDFGF